MMAKENLADLAGKTQRPRSPASQLERNQERVWLPLAVAAAMALAFLGVYEVTVAWQ